MQKRNLLFALFLAGFLICMSILGAGKVAPAFSLAQEEKRVYLTFDDGPSTVVTNRILDILKEEEVKATFFIVSDRAKSRKQTLLRIYEEGHTVGVHSASHEYQKIYSSDEAFLRDVKECADYITSTLGKAPTVYRFPGGRAKKELLPLIEGEGLRSVAWNACCRDEEIPNATAEQLLSETVRTAQGKSPVVLLCHDSASHAATAEALPRIIAYFRAEGYEFCAY